MTEIKQRLHSNWEELFPNSLQRSLVRDVVENIGLNPDVQRVYGWSRRYKEIELFYIVNDDSHLIEDSVSRINDIYEKITDTCKTVLPRGYVIRDAEAKAIPYRGIIALSTLLWERPQH